MVLVRRQQRLLAIGAPVRYELKWVARQHVELLLGPHSLLLEELSGLLELGRPARDRIDIEALFIHFQLIIELQVAEARLVMLRNPFFTRVVAAKRLLGSDDGLRAAFYRHAFTESFVFESADG